MQSKKSCSAIRLVQVLFLHPLEALQLFQEALPGSASTVNVLLDA